jgi:peptidoglycan hydrolase CwlO-like protein
MSFVNTAPEALRDYANVALIVGLVIATFDTFGVNYFRSQVEKHKQQQSDERATTLQTKVNELVTGKDELLRQNSELSELVKSLRGQVGDRDLIIQQLNNEIAATKRYAYIATLTFNGMVYTWR